MARECSANRMGDRKRRVLLIDDEEAIVRILGRLLQVAGFEVLAATDGKDGLAKAQAERPDAIVLDLMLPALNGFEVCAALKQDGATQQIPVIIFTARGRGEEQRCRELGASAFFNKTDPASELIAKIKSLLGMASG